MIVQELQKIQERLGWLPHDEMQALATRLRVPLHRVHEVATFYPLYRLEPPPTVDIRVCRDMACHVQGAEKAMAGLKATFSREVATKQLHVEGVSCLGQCDRILPCIVNDHHVYFSKTEAEMADLVRLGLQKKHLPHQNADEAPLPWKIDIYEGKPAYEAVHRFCKGELSPEEVIKRLETSSLRGLGGAGFPTFRKWATVRTAPGDKKYVFCNADESEPGTFKDRELLRRTPWLTIEGMILAALLVGADQGYLYLRHEYIQEAEVCRKAIKQAYDMGVLGKNILGTGKNFDLELYMSPGGYVQGEESALLEAIEDKRGEPRNKPPFPVFQGLFGKPTVINNVETLAWTPGIMRHGGEWYRDGGINGAQGMRFVSISGDVVRPGVYETPFGLTIGELINGLAGGMRDGLKLQAIAPSGPSGGFLPAFLQKEKMPRGFVDKFMNGKDTYDILDLPMDNGTLATAGSMLGAAFIVYGSQADIVENALNCVEFYRNESCGKCVPCRTGSQKLVRMIGELLAGNSSRVKLNLISDLADTMIITSICGLGQVASNPISTVIRHFPDDVDRYLKNGR
jgi:NADH:ubiquinone oxidoreductase subunit F (NADH-binding)/NADH:ubiquinone oxidoreductase subunit E